MNRFIVWGLVPWLILAAASAIRAQEPSRKTSKPQATSTPKAESPTATPAERYRDVLKAYQKDQQELFKAYRAAKTDAERQKILETKRPDEESYADKMLKIAEDAPKDPVAVEALVWVALNTGGPKADRAMKELIRSHVQDPKIAFFCARMVYDNSPQSERFLREVLAKNPDREAKGHACLALGQRLKMAAERAGSKEKSESMTREAESFLERVAREFGDIKFFRGTLGDVAKNELNELRHLGIGKTAPEITGQDIDGKSMKLTEFRGKIVVLDFWGDW